MATRPETTVLFEALRREVIARFKSDPAQELGLRELASELSVSPRQLQRAFADAGSTLRDALAVVRAHRAAELLQSPRTTVAEIASAVGYRQPAHFAKAFRRVHGMSPAEYRQEQDRLRLVEWRRVTAERAQAESDEDLARWLEVTARLTELRKRAGARSRRNPHAGEAQYLPAGGWGGTRTTVSGDA